MRRLRLIRFRLTLTYTLLLTGAFALFSAGIFLALHIVLYDNFQNKLQQAAESVGKSTKVSVSYSSYPNFHINLHVNSETFGGDVGQNLIRTAVVNVNGLQIPGDNKGDTHLASSPQVQQIVKKSLASGSNESVNVKTKGGDTTIMAIPLTSDAAPYVLLVQSSVQDVEDTLQLLLRILLLSAVAMTVISATGAWFLTGRVLRPIEEITDKARRITAHDLSQRLNIATQDEFGRLAGTFDGMIARLEASFDRQKRFTSDASHEMRTPLTIMQADISLALRRPRTNVEYKRTLESAQEEVTRLSHIVTDLLTLARLDTDLAQIAHEPVALDELINSVVNGLRPLATDRSILLSYAIDGPATISGDSTRLKQLFINLIDNAISYSPNGGYVHVGLTSTPDWVMVTVKDNGMGIQPYQLEHIFERFYRAEEARLRNHEGTGLGLAIAQGAAQAHQGRIDVSSVVGQGTAFTVLLPCDATQEIPSDTVHLAWPLPTVAVAS